MSIENVALPHIDEIINIAKINNLSYWSKRDYLLELARNDSYLRTFISSQNTCHGFLVGRVIKYTETPIENEGEIYNIGVLPSAKRKGIGKELLTDYINFCRKNDVNQIWLEVRESNSDAIKFYKSFGFKQYSIRRNFYNNPLENGLTYCLTLI